MLKKYIIILLLTICTMLVTYFAIFHNKIPFWRVDEYRTEMETIINKWIPESEKIINDEVECAKGYKENIINNKLTRESDDYHNLGLSSEYAASMALLHLYSDLVRATSKYMYIDTTRLHTDFYGVPANFIDPYLKKYKVDTQKLYELESYVLDKNKIIDGYVQEVKKIIDSNS